MSVTGYISFDQETPTGNTIHGPEFRDPNNDIFTMIYGDHPKRIKLLHSKKGFKRKLPYRLGKLLLKSHTMITQNGKFDLCYIWKDKYFQRWLKKGGKLWDCQLARYLLTAQRHSYASLAELQKIYLGIKTKKDRISWLFSRGIGADKIIAAKDRCPRVWQLYCDYGIEDGRTPLLIMQKQYKEAKAKGMLKIIRLYNEYLLALCMTEQNGIDLDMQQLEINEKEIALEELEYLEKATSIAAKYWSDERLPVLNINSNDHKSLLLFGGYINCDVTITLDEVYKSGKKAGEYKTKKIKQLVRIRGFELNSMLSNKAKKEGFYATGKEIIEKIYKKSNNEDAKQFCKYMVLAAHSQKMLNTYVRAFKNRSVNGKLYPNFNNTETATGRLSSSKPNLQNVPATGRYNILLQGLFIAPEDWTCCSIDFSQLEVWVQALLSCDSKLCADLMNGIDFHVKRMCWMPEVQKLGVTYDEGIRLAKIEEVKEWVQRRKEAKPIGFKKAYGGSAESLAATTGISLADMKEIYRKEDEEYWQLVKYEEYVKEEVIANSDFSYQSDFADKYTKGNKDGEEVARRFSNGIELLPIKECKGSSNYLFKQDYLRHVGYYQSPTGKLYAFEERATWTKNNEAFRYYRSTEMKNYMVQGCLHGDTAIFTKEYGKSNISELIGKSFNVWTDGGYSQASCCESGEKQLCIINFKDGNSIKCSPEHRFKYVNPSSNYEGWITADEIINKKLQNKRVAIKLGDEIEFDSLALLDEPKHINRPSNFKYVSANTIGDYLELGLFLGRIASDGWVRENKSVRLTIAEHEENILPLLFSICDKVGQYRVRTKLRKNRNQRLTHIDFDSTCLAEQLKDLKKCIPTQCWKNKKLLRGYLSGVFDGDGSINNEGQVILTFGEQEHKIKWAIEVQLALRLFGIRSRLKIGKRYIRVIVMKADAPIFYSKIGFINKVKQDKLSKFKGTKRNRHNYAYVESAIKTNEYVFMYDVVNSANKTFCANGLVTHNTAADIQAMTTAEMFQFLIRNTDKVKMLNEIHDSKWFIIKNEHLDCIVRKLCGIMTDVKNILKRRFNIDTDLTFAVEAKCGGNFAEMETYHV